MTQYINVSFGKNLCICATIPEEICFHPWIPSIDLWCLLSFNKKNKKKQSVICKNEHEKQKRITHK